MIVVLLQNPWSGYYAGREWPRDEWLDAMWSSYTGGMLMKLLAGIPDDEVWVDNANPICTPKPSGMLKPDIEHVSRVLAAQCASGVVACGSQAHKAIDKVRWMDSLVVTPHPAYRLFSNDWAYRCNECIRDLHRHPKRLKRIQVNWKNYELLPIPKDNQ